MTNQEVIEILEHLKPSNQVYTANDAYAVGQALCIAIETMRKYQKIEQIIKDIPYGGDVTVRRIQEVLEDGNDD